MYKHCFFYLILIVQALTWAEVKFLENLQTGPNVKAVSFSKNSESIIFAGNSQQIQIVSLPDFIFTHKINVGSEVRKILVHPTTGNFYVSTNDGRIIIYNKTTYSEEKSIAYHGIVNDMDWSFQGTNLLVVGSKQSSIIIYDINLIEQSRLKIATQLNQIGLQQIDASPDSQTYATSSIPILPLTQANGTKNSNIFLLNNDGSLQQCFNYGTQDIKLLRFSKNGNQLFAAQRGTDTLKVYDIFNIEKNTFSFENIKALNSDLQDDSILVGYQSTVSIFDHYQGKSLQDLAQRGEILTISVSINQEYIAVGLENGLSVWASTASQNDDNDNKDSGFVAPVVGAAGGVLLVAVGALTAHLIAGLSGAAGINAKTDLEQNLENEVLAPQNEKANN